MTTMLTDQYHGRLPGTLSCYDRMVNTWTLPGAFYAAGMTGFLKARHIRIFDHPRFAKPLHECVRSGAQALAVAQGAQIENVAKAHGRKEEAVAAVIKRRGDHPDVAHGLMRVEYAADLAFRSDAIMKPLYGELSRQATFSVKAEQVASFLGRKITPQHAQEVSSRFATRIEGTCAKHDVGQVPVRMYDKFGRVLRLGTTTNDVSFFKHHRKVERRDGHQSREIAPFKKTIYSVIDLREILLGCNRRYLEHLSALSDLSVGDGNLHRLTSPKAVNGHALKALNCLDHTQQALLHAPQRPAFNVRVTRRADLMRFLPHVSASGMTRYLWRLRQFGLIKKVVHSYRYYRTRLGRSAIAAGSAKAERAYHIATSEGL